MRSITAANNEKNTKKKSRSSLKCTVRREWYILILWRKIGQS